MRPGHKTPENAVRVDEGQAPVLASMRPGHKTPENRAAPTTCSRSGSGFNEAGAQDPGKLAHRLELPIDQVASMRPGHKTPENRTSPKPLRISSFAQACERCAITYAESHTRMPATEQRPRKCSNC